MCGREFSRASFALFALAQDELALLPPLFDVVSDRLGGDIVEPTPTTLHNIRHTNKPYMAIFPSPQPQ